MAEKLIVFLSIALAATYACWRIYKAFQQANDPCAGCAGCELKGKITKKSGCTDKNRAKNLAEQKKHITFANAK